MHRAKYEDQIGTRFLEEISLLLMWFFSSCLPPLHLVFQDPVPVQALGSPADIEFLSLRPPSALVFP